ncbi:DUF2993 domain-containing protein [Streptomyces sp. ODS28]|uniref:LmeA family phospholipid-binding protein n=1 Tax=Streptomyces sp. ODS28 TaxID=3136688 RepID=UPI0031E5138E
MTSPSSSRGSTGPIRKAQSGQSEGKETEEKDTEKKGTEEKSAEKKDSDASESGAKSPEAYGRHKKGAGKNKRIGPRLRTSFKIGTAVVVVLAFLAVGDRWAVLYAEDKAAEKVQSSLKLRAKPEVHIPGFPFLTQLATDRVDKADIKITDAPGGRISVAWVTGTTRDVQLTTGGSPLDVKGAKLGAMRGNVVIAFDDLDRELGTSQVKFHPGKRPGTVKAEGQVPIEGKKVKVRADAHLHRIGQHGVGTTVYGMKLDVPGLFSYTPGKTGGLRLAKPFAERVQHDTAKARALFQVRTVAEHFGLTPKRAAEVRRSEAALHRITGQPKFADKLMRVNMLDAIVQNPALLKKAGIDPALVDAVKKMKVPKLADRLSWSMRLPETPAHVKLQKITVRKEGIVAEVTSPGMKVGDA